MSGAGGAKVLRALVVDDEEHLARLVADYLAREGFTTQVALDGEHAWTSPAPLARTSWSWT